VGDRALILALLLACAATVTRVGLISTVGGLVLLGADGARYPLSATGDAAPLAALQGISVEVTGPRLAGTLVVRDWRVLDAGDGSAGVVGTLRAWGARLYVDDRNTGRPVFVVADASLFPYVGRVILAAGYADARGEFHVVGWKPLDGRP
jgi:hypothetical protein